jgi:sugar phosphate isomerase/epimerase
LKLGLSTWSLLRLDLNSAVRAIGDAGFEYLELWGEVPHAYPEWGDRKALKDTLSTYGMVVTMHAPFTDLNPASPFQPVQGAVGRTLEDFVRFSDFLGAAMITIHPGSVHNEALVPQSTANSIEAIRRMVRACRGRMTVNVENQAKGRSKYHFPLASTIESLELILAEVEGLKFTLDTGHAHVNGLDPLALATRESTSLREVHLSDNQGGSDDHLIPGEGTAKLQGVLDWARGTDVLVCLELDPHRYAEQQVLGAVEGMRTKLGLPRKGGA